MPIYEYECGKCGKTIEVIQKFSDKPLKKHADCGGVLTKLISQSAFQLKGTGWYVTDYAKKSGAPASESKESETKESGTKSESPSKEPSTPAAAKPSSDSGKKSSDS